MGGSSASGLLALRALQRGRRGGKATVVK